MPYQLLLGNPESNTHTSFGVLTASAPMLKPPYFPAIVAIHAGQHMTISSIIRNNDDIYDWAYSIVTEVRDSQGITLMIHFESGLARAHNQSEAAVSWQPKQPGRYELRTFAISGLDSPQILSRVNSSNVVIQDANNNCDQSLWQNVYGPDRLKKIDECISVTGLIRTIKAENDGDYHVLIKLDSEYAELINQENVKNQNGNLVVEPICQRPTSQRSVIAACHSFNGTHMEIPAVGSRVKVTGSYVLDINHGGWAEIHPATSIVLIERPEADNNTMPPPSPQEELRFLSIDINFAHNPIVRGKSQTITVIVTDANTGDKIKDAMVNGTVTYASGKTTKSIDQMTDVNGQVTYTWTIGADANPGIFTANVTISAPEYQDASKSSFFTVLSNS